MRFNLKIGSLKSAVVWHFGALAFFALPPSPAAALSGRGLCEILIDAVDQNTPRPAVTSILLKSDIGRGELHAAMKAQAADAVRNAIDDTSTAAAMRALRNVTNAPHSELALIREEQTRHTDEASRYHISKLTPRQDREVQAAVRSTKVDKVVEYRKGKNGASDKSVQDAAILEAIRHVQSGGLVGPTQIAAIRELRNRVKSLPDRVEKLEEKSNFVGESEMMVASYLMENDKKFRKQIAELTDDNYLYISVPKVSKNLSSGEIELSGEVKRFKSIDDYDSYFNRLQAVATQVTNLRQARKVYLEDYLFARTFARRLPGTLEENSTVSVKFSHDSHMDPDELALKANYENYVADIAQIFDGELPIHPAPAALRAQSRETNTIHRFKKTATVVLTAAATVLAYIGTADGIQAKYKRGAAALEDEIDESNAFNEAYWINKCSKKATAEEIDKCIDDFSNTLATAIDKKVLVKTKADPSYNDVSEKAESDRLIIAVVNAIYQKLPTRLYIALNTLAAKKYGKDTIYNTAKLQVLKEQEEKKLPSTPTQLVSSNGKPMGDNQKIFTNKDIENRVAKVKKEFGETRMSFDSNLETQKDSAKAMVATRLQYVIFLKNASAYLLQTKEVSSSRGVEEEILSQLKEMDSELTREMNNIIAQVPEVAVAVKAADPSMIVESADGKLTMPFTEQEEIDVPPANR